MLEDVTFDNLSPMFILELPMGVSGTIQDIMYDWLISEWALVVAASGANETVLIFGT